MADEQEQPERQGLLDADHGTGGEDGSQPDQQQQQQQPVAAALQSPAGLQTAAAPGSPACEDPEASPPGRERSLLSRQGSITSLLRVPPPPPPSGLRLTLPHKAAGWFVTTLLLGVLAAVGLTVLAFGEAPEGAAPTSRAGAAVAVLPATANCSQRLVVWSGRGQDGYLFHDVHTLSLADLQWKQVKERGASADEQPPLPADAELQRQQEQQGGQPQQQQQQQRKEQQQRQHDQPLPLSPQQQVAAWRLPRPRSRRPRKPEAPRPGGRWKEASVQLGERGLLIHGGDASNKSAPSTYKDDAWLLGFRHLRWQQGSYCGDSGGCPSAPAPRRAHTLVAYSPEGEEGQQVVLLFGGRREDGLLMNDVWAGALGQAPGPGPNASTAAGASSAASLDSNSTASLNISWSLIHDPQSGVGTGPAPLPRRGHVALMLNSTHMLLHGGRSEVYGSFSDVWLFDVPARRWQPLQPATAVQPAPRDFHGAAVFKGRLFIFGGRFGTVAEALHPMGDRWVLDLQTRTWRQLPLRGLSPLPRFLFASTQYTPAGGGPDQLILFGGQTGSILYPAGDSCLLNDVWAIDLENYRWTQLSQATFADRRCGKIFG